MSIMGCPNKNLASYQALVNEYGEGRALAAFSLNGDNIPTVEQAKELLEPTLFNTPIAFDEVKRRILSGFTKYGQLVNKVVNGTRMKDDYTTATGRMSRDIAVKMQQWIDGIPEFSSARIVYSPVYNSLKIVPIYNVRSNINEHGRITDINFPTGGYEGTARAPVEMVLSDPRVLFLFPDGGFIRMAKYEESTDKKLSYLTRLWLNLPDSKGVSALLGKSLEELYSSVIRGDAGYSLVISSIIASRLLNTNNFSGRVADSIYKRELGKLPYIGIINNPAEKAPFYSNGQQIIINSARVESWMKEFGTYEDFIKGAELTLTEEVIHLLTFKLTTDEELVNIYNELPESTRKEFAKTYNFSTNYTPQEFSHEYIRTIIQEDIFSTSTNRELGAPSNTVLAIIKRALDYIVDLFKTKPTPIAKQVIQRIKDYIGNSAYQKTASTTAPDPKLEERITKFVRSIGGNVKHLADTGQPYAATVDTLRGIISVVDGKAGIDTLGHEATHLMLDLLPDNSKLLADIVDQVQNTDEYDKVYEEYKDLPEYQLGNKETNQNKTLKYDIQSEILGSMEGRLKENTIQSTISYLTRLEKDSPGVNGRTQNVDRVWKEIQKNGNEYSKKLGVSYISGAEHRVYEGQNSVIKVKYDQKVDDITSYLKKLLIYNKLFPETAYTLKGFIKEGNKILPVVEQSAVIKNGEYDQGTVANILNKYGMSEQLEDDEDGNTEYGKGVFYNSELGVSVSDLGPKNVLFRDGIPFFIDPIITAEEKLLNPTVVQRPQIEVDEVKIAKEAAAHIIDDIIVQRYKDKKALKWWERLWQYIRNIFKGQTLDLFNLIAEDILSGNTERLSPEKVAAMKEAMDRGEIYYQLDDRDMAYIKGMMRTATDAQKKVINDTVLNPVNRVVLDEATHTYTDTKGQVYNSVTVLLNGKTHLDPEDFALNKAWGNDFDGILQGIALGKRVDQIETKTLTEEQKAKAYDILSEFYSEVAGPGDIVLTQVIVSDSVSKVAGSIDVLVVHPDGNTDILDLKTIGKNKSYTTAYTPGEGAVIQEPLSRKMKHGIQVASYRRLLGTMGYPNSNISAIYVELDIEGDRKEQVLQGFDKGSWVRFTETSWDSYAQKIVPTEPVEREQDQLYTEEEVTPNDNPEAINTDIPQDTEQKIDYVLSQAERIFSERMRYFQALERGGGAFIPRQSTVNELNSLLFNIRKERSVGKREAAYGRLMTHMQTEMDEWLRYIGNPKNYNDKNYYNVIDEISKFLQSYRGLPWVRSDINEGQQAAVNRLQDTIDALQTTISKATWQYITKKVGERYQDMTPEAVDELIRIQQDISKKALWGSDIAGSRDYLLALVDTTVKRQLDKRDRLTAEMKEKIAEMGNKFTRIAGKPSKDTFKFIYEGDRMLQKISPVYYNLRDEADSLVMNDDGTWMQYKQITTTEGVKEEDLQYNRDLAERKSKRAQFMSAEQFIEGEAVGGEYHEYTQEFKGARSKVMRVVNRRYKSSWERKPGISDAEFSKFQRDYMVYNPYWKMTYKKGVPTGVVTWVEDDSAWFPRSEYIQVRDTTESGKDMVNPRYTKLMNPVTELEKVQKEAYMFYMDIMEDYTSRMGPTEKMWLKEGNMITLRGGFSQQVHDSGLFKALKGTIVNEMRPTIFASTVVTDETGTVRQAIPRMYMGGLQDQAKVVALNQKMEDLAQQLSQQKISKKVYNEQKKDLNYQLSIELAKPTSANLEYDIFKQLSAYTDMAENFIQLSEIEGQVKALTRAIEGKIIDPETGLGRKYYNENAKGEIILEAGTEKPAWVEDPNAVKRVRAYISQVFYNDKNLTKDQAEVITKRIMNYTSLLSVGLNIFGNINNYVLGKVSGTLAAAGGKYFSRSAYVRAQRDMTTQIIPGQATKLAEKVSDRLTGSKEPYGHKKAQSKGEALIEKYRIVREQKSGEENVDIAGRLGAYKLQQGGEYVAQGVPGLAVLMTSGDLNPKIRTMKSTITGETCSIYDAHEFKDGKLSLREGFTETQEELFQTTNYIFEVNKDMHGSYAYEDATYLQKDLWGKLIMQFHKHIMPGLRNRFAKPYIHPVLGAYEGRYTTVWQFIQNLRDYDGVWNRAVMSWNELTPLQKKNMLQNGAEVLTLMIAYSMYVLISGIADGLDPDEDPYLRKFANFLAYQSSRLYSEQVALTPTPMGAVQMYQYVKNPVAMSGTIGRFADAVMSTTELPFQQLGWVGSPEDSYYQKGVYKGQLKAWSKFKKVIPLISNIQKWLSFEQQSRFSLIGS